MKRRFFFGTQGQAAVEYILLMVVLVTIITSLMGLIRSRLLADQGQCQENSESFICRLERMYSSQNFKYFTIRR